MSPEGGSVDSIGRLTGCGSGWAIAIDELQLEGKRRMQAREFINGYQPKPGEKMGS